MDCQQITEPPRHTKMSECADYKSGRVSGAHYLLIMGATLYTQTTHMQETNNLTPTWLNNSRL